MTWVVVHLMSHSLLLIMVFLKLLQYQEILTLEVKTLIRDLLNILLKSLKRNTTLTLRKIFVLSKSSSPRQRKQREISHQYFKLRFKLRVLLMVSISMRQSQELALKNFVQTFLRRPLFQSKLFLMIHLSRNLKLMKLILYHHLPVLIYGIEVCADFDAGKSFSRKGNCMPLSRNLK